MYYFLRQYVELCGLQCFMVGGEIKNNHCIIFGLNSVNFVRPNHIAMKHIVKFILILSCFTIIRANAQSKADLMELPQKLRAEVQSGYLEIESTVKNAGLLKGNEHNYKVTVHFYRTESGVLNFIIENGNTIYLRKGNSDLCFYKQDDVFKEKKEFNSPTNVNRGLIPIWLNDSFLAPLLRSERYKFSKDGELDLLTYRGMIDGDLHKSTVIEFGFKGIYPVYTRTSIPGRSMTQISISRLKDFKLNPYTEESFEKLFLETLVKVMKPSADNPKERFLEASPKIYNHAGDQIKEDWKKLNLLVMLPGEVPSMDALSYELKKINEQHPNEVKILPIASAKDHLPIIPAEMKSLFGLHTIDPEYQWNNSLHSNVVLIVFFDEKRKIVNTLNLFQHSDAEKLGKAVQEYLN